MNPFEASEVKFENVKVRLKAEASIPRLHVAGLELKPVEAGERFEASRWVAEDLVKAGIARFEEVEAEFSLAELQRVRLLEGMQQQRRPGQLPENFYPRLRRLLRRLKAEASKSPEKMVEYGKAYQWASDLLALRLNKILVLASARGEAGESLKNLTEEELALYRSLHRTVEEWKSQAFSWGV
ncbi:hypothetical protein DRO53_05065 [Candidatus Bathyarchaeota archaeon]|nr:MAG: hypothetical protein DRO53_05065 [Candidatus Bathyarchaeota archaeon]